MKNDSGNTTLLVVNDDKEVVRTTKTKEQVNAILAMHANGMTAHAMGHALGCSPHTVERYVEQGEWRPRRQAKGKLHGLENWLTERFLRHRGVATKYLENYKNWLRRQTSRPDKRVNSDFLTDRSFSNMQPH